MKIALYYPWIYLRSGVERTIVETLKRSRHNITIFTNHYEPTNTFPELRNFPIIQLKNISVQRDLFSVLTAAITIFFQKIDLTNYDVLLIHSDGLGDLLLARNHSIPAVCYCHTPLRPVYDPHYGWQAFSKLRGVQKLLFIFFKAQYKRVNAYLYPRYSSVLFNSRESYTRAGVGGLLRKQSHCAILHPGVSKPLTKLSWKYEQYFFLPGRIMWTKNIEFAIQAFIQFMHNPKHNHYKLVIAGHVDHKEGAYLNSLRKIAREHSNIIFILDPSDLQMASLYRDCRAVLLASFNEDWGLTLLEGNSYAKPSITINNGGPIEHQIHNYTGFISRLRVSSYAQHMEALARSLPLTKKLGLQAYNNVKKYSWSAYVRLLNNALEQSKQEMLH